MRRKVALLFGTKNSHVFHLLRSNQIVGLCHGPVQPAWEIYSLIHIGGAGGAETQESRRGAETCIHYLVLLYVSHCRELTSFLFKAIQSISTDWTLEDMQVGTDCEEETLSLKTQWHWAVSGSCWWECWHCFVHRRHWGVGTCLSILCACVSLDGIH